MALGQAPPFDPAQAQQAGMMNPMMPPQAPPTTPPVFGFQVWAQDPANAHKVQAAMTGPGQPLQPNAPNAMAPPVQPQMSSIAPPQQQLGQDQQHLRDLQQSGAAADHVQNPFLHVLAKAGDIAAPFILGGGAAAIPGTTAHNLFLQRQASGNIERDQTALQSAAQLADTQSQTAQRTALGNKANAQAEAIPDATATKQDAGEISLATHGLRRVTGPDGRVSIVPDEQSPVFQKQQIANQLAQSSIALKGAQAEYEKSKSNPNSPVFKLAAQRLQIAQQTQDRLTGMMGTMQERADANMMTAKARTLGVDMNNKPLAGSMVTDEGDVVGGMNAANVRPTGTQRSKGNMAESADQQINDMKSIVASRPDIFGPAAGRKTDFDVWLGSQDPDAQRFRAARTIAGDHLAGTFGGRSEAALSALDSAIGHFRDNPAAVTAGLNQLQEANRLFMKAGKVKTVGSAGTRNNMQPPTQGGATKAADPLGIR